MSSFNLTSLLTSPGWCRQFGFSGGCIFCLVTNAALADLFKIEEIGEYSRFMVVPFDQGDSFEDLLDRVIPEPAHVLVVSPNAFFRSPTPEKIGRRKLMAMACNSTPTPIDAVDYFLSVIERTDPEFQQIFANRFFALAESSEHLRFIDGSSGTSTVFEHLSNNCEWNLQAGPIGWGEQQLAPAGEMSALPTEILRFDPALRLRVHGEIAFRGQPIVHSGTASHLQEDQARIHSALASIGEHPVVATVDNGFISGLRATHARAQPAVEMLEAMFAVDSRYRILWEVGFGINTALKSPLPGNHGMNEVSGATNGTVHWGLGLTPYTQYALILPSLDTRVIGASGAVLLGPPNSAPRFGMRRRTVGGCICHS